MYNLLLLILLGFIFNTVQSLRFDLQSGHTKCIAEDIKTNSMFVAKYTIVNPNDSHPFPESHKITVRVSFHFHFHFLPFSHLLNGLFSNFLSDMCMGIAITMQNLWSQDSFLFRPLRLGLHDLFLGPRSQATVYDHH
ncbi:hypothetical protein ACSBR1_003065 [Camellia fascicularis]